jgi:hypothetical protein
MTRAKADAVAAGTRFRLCIYGVAMADIPSNLAMAGAIKPPVTVPDPWDQPNVEARVVSRWGERWVSGQAKGWTKDAVLVVWTDQSLGRMQWFMANDVRRA